MTYVMSDLHGQYDKFMKMLDKIGFSDEDDLYILGDVIDRGPEPVRLLQEIAEMPNVTPLCGNHELMALSLLRTLAVEITAENHQTQLTEDTMSGLLAWQQDGGEVTLQQFCALSVPARRDLLDYLESFSLYETVDVGDRTYILVHAGLGNYRPDKKLRDYTAEELTCLPHDYDRRCFDDPNVFVVCGHVPTKMICGEWRIFRSENNICIDCGATFTGQLACLCLETQQEYYV